MSLHATVSRGIARHGAKYTLRRETITTANSWTAASVAVAYSPVMAKERGFKPNEIRGGIQENDCLVVVDAATASTPPKIGDRVALGEFSADVGAAWRQVVNVYATTAKGKVASYRLQVRA